MGPIVYPTINGARPDFMSMVISVSGADPKAIFPIKVPLIAIKALNYKTERDGSLARGGGQTPLGKTIGAFTSTASLTMHKPEYQAFILALSSMNLLATGKTGYMTAFFNISVQYSFGDLPIMQDVIYGCSIKSESEDHKQGGEALEVSCDLDPIYISKNGVFPSDDLDGFFQYVALVLAAA
jgi:hypothetical protein